MNIGSLRCIFIGHSTFLFRSAGGQTVLVDPFFADGFQLGDHYERYLSPPAVSPGDIRRCDCIFVSHIHGDHYDPDAIEIIMKNTSARLYAPAEVIDDFTSRGATSSRLECIEENGVYTVGDLSLQTCAGYDNSYDALKRANKYSLIIDDGMSRLFYSGDCHHLPPCIKGERFDSMFCWPHTSDTRLVELCTGIAVRRFVMMHTGRFAPGKFICNVDTAAEKARIERCVPGLHVIIPQPVENAGQLTEKYGFT
jgi:L-ascorbate metabolism protein UlaG (beta-lactamase superfamily)